jgi:lipopolysaccharide export system permease protein
MRILTRYLLRAHLGPFFFALSVLTGLLLINTVARRFEELAGKGLSPSIIAEVFLLSIPYTLALTFPMSVLVAVLYVFSQLTADNEITALKASGVSLRRLVAPLLLTAVALTIGMVWFNDRILPEANHRLKNLLMDIARKSPTVELKEQAINELRTESTRTRYFLQAADIDPTTNRLFDIVIYDLSQPDRDRTIYADSGKMAFNRSRTDLYLTLYDGRIHERTVAEPEKFNRMYFTEQLVRIPEIGNELERMNTASRGDREMSVAMLAAEIEQRRAELEEVRRQAREQVVGAVADALRGPAVDDTGGVAAAAGTAGAGPSPGATSSARRIRDQVDPVTRRVAVEMRSLQGRAEMLQQGINRHRVELHKKYAIPFACIVFVLIGAPLAVRFPRGGVGMVIAFSLVIFSIYWMGLTGGEQLGDKGKISPAWAMWVVNVVFLGLGIWAFARFGRETSTTRGNAWDDLRDAVRGLLRRHAAAGRDGRR